MKALLLAIVLVATTGQLAFADCPKSTGEKPWREVGSSCFQIVPTRMKWSLARQHCQGLLEGSDLATLADKQQVLDVLWYVTGYDTDLSKCPSFFHWIGVTDIGHDEDFQVIDGSKFFYWKLPYEPHHKPNQEDCGGMNPHDGPWYGDPCNLEHCFICETAAI